MPHKSCRCVVPSTTSGYTHNLSAIMKTACILSISALVLSAANAFAPAPAFCRFPQQQQQQTNRFASDPEDEEEGLDLNLEEMFDM
jgi:hypothetical protein